MESESPKTEEISALKKQIESLTLELESQKQKYQTLENSYRERLVNSIKAIDNTVVIPEKSIQELEIFYDALVHGFTLGKHSYAKEEGKEKEKEKKAEKNEKIIADENMCGGLHKKKKMFHALWGV